MAKALTAISVANLKKKPERYEVSDSTPGLRVVVQPSGAKAYIVRYRYKGKPRKLTLGPCLFEDDVGDNRTPEVGMPVTLAEARELCTKALREAKGDTDPAAAKQKKRQEEAAAESDTLQATVALYLKREGPRMRTVKQRKADLELICESLGQFRVAEIKRSQFTKVLEAIADGEIDKKTGKRKPRPVRAHRCQTALKSLLNWYAGRDDDNYVNPMLVRGAGGQRAGEKRERVLDDDEIRAIWRAASADTGPFGPFLMFTLLTATRRGEGAGLTRDELSKDGTTWVIPKSRYKTGTETLIPLSKAAQKIVASMPDRGPYIFSADGSKPIMGFSDRKKAFDKVSGVKGWRLHDLRRTARTIMSRAGVRPDIGEMCLGHKVGGIRGIYDRFAFEDEKRAAFEALSALIERIVSPPANNVVTLKKKARRK